MLKFKSWHVLTYSNNQFNFRKLIWSDGWAPCSGHRVDRYMGSHGVGYKLQSAPDKNQNILRVKIKKVLRIISALKKKIFKKMAVLQMIC